MAVQTAELAVQAEAMTLALVEEAGALAAVVVRGDGEVLAAHGDFQDPSRWLPAPGAADAGGIVTTVATCGDLIAVAVLGDGALVAVFPPAVREELARAALRGAAFAE